MREIVIRTDLCKDIEYIVLKEDQIITSIEKLYKPFIYNKYINQGFTSADEDIDKLVRRCDFTPEEFLDFILGMFTDLNDKVAIWAILLILGYPEIGEEYTKYLKEYLQSITSDNDYIKINVKDFVKSIIGSNAERLSKLFASEINKLNAKI